MSQALFLVAFVYSAFGFGTAAIYFVNAQADGFDPPIEEGVQILIAYICWPIVFRQFRENQR